MNKDSILPGIMILFFIAIFSGCIEQNNDVYTHGNNGDVSVQGDTDKVEILDYTVQSVIYNRSSSWPESVDGFVYCKDTLRYKINGTAKNIAGKSLDNVEITARFFRSENKGMFYSNSKTDSENSIADNETWDFKIEYYRNENNFGTVDWFDFKISVLMDS